MYQSVSYHVDHGNGLDCYKVGPTLIGGLSDHKIVKGLDKGVINQLLGGKLRGEMVVVARGKLPVRGEDGYYESFISDREHNGVIVNKDGTVDYTKAALFVKVTAGQKAG